MLRPRALTAPPLRRRIKEELKELTQDSNERMLAALYPVRSPDNTACAPLRGLTRPAFQGWSGDTSGCALLLCAIESSWTAVAARQARQQEGAAYADAASARVAAAASARRDAWRPLEMELARLPELTVGMQEASAMAGRLLSRLDSISAALDAAEAAAWAAPLAAREAAAVRAAAAAETRHANDLALLAAEGDKRRRWAASRAAMEENARRAPGVLPRRLRVGPAADARRLANVEVDLSEATASLRNFLENSPELKDGEPRASRCDAAAMRAPCGVYAHAHPFLPSSGAVSRTRSAALRARSDPTASAGGGIARACGAWTT